METNIDFETMIKSRNGRVDIIGKFSEEKEDNWQNVFTPLDICKEMCDLIEGDCQYAVLFNLEFLEVLIHEKSVLPCNIVFFGDGEAENNFAEYVYGVKTGLLDKNELISDGRFSKEKFGIVLKTDIDKSFGNYYLKNVEQEENMKFTKLAVIGNPPYQQQSEAQKNRTETGTQQAKSIYHLFVESIIDNLNPDYLSLIIPSRWMIGGMGLNSFRERIKEDKSFKVIVDDMRCDGIFETVDVSGGVCYFLRDKSYSGKCNFNGTERFLNEEDIIVRENECRGILTKVKSVSSKYIGSLVSPQNPYGFHGAAEPLESGIPCYFKQKIGKKFVDKTQMKAYKDNVDMWKVLVPSAPIAGQTDFTKPIGFFNENNIILCEPGTICTETYIVLSTFETRKEAEHFISYVKTKFFRFMLKMRVVSQHILRDCYSWVPDMEDYSSPWTDEELYKKFNLTRQQIIYIESKIKEFK